MTSCMTPTDGFYHVTLFLVSTWLIHLSFKCTTFCTRFWKLQWIWKISGLFGAGLPKLTKQGTALEWRSHHERRRKQWFCFCSGRPSENSGKTKESPSKIGECGFPRFPAHHPCDYSAGTIGVMKIPVQYTRNKWPKKKSVHQISKYDCVNNK